MSRRNRIDVTNHSWIKRLIEFWNNLKISHRASAEIKCKRPVKCVQVVLYADVGKPMLSYLEWNVTPDQLKELARARSVMLGISIWEDEGTSTSLSGLAHFLLNKHQDQLPNIFGCQACDNVDQSHRKLPPRSKSNELAVYRIRIRAALHAVYFCP